MNNSPTVNTADIWKINISELSEGRWNNLEDIKVLKMNGPIPSYYSSSAKAHALEFFQKMEERMVKIYG